MLDDLRARLGERQMKLEITDDARRFIAQQGYDPVYGARPLRRLISREVETRIGRALLSGDILDGAVIRVGYADGELPVGYENPAHENPAHENAACPMAAAAAPAEVITCPHCGRR